MSPSREYHIGRDPLSDIVIDDVRVSWHHAVLRPLAGHWSIEDEGSTNGTYCGGRRIGTSDVGPGTVIRFGHPADGPQAVLSGRSSADPEPLPPDRPSAVSMPAATGTFRQPTTVRPLPTRTLRIGRGSGNDLVVDDLSVSRCHAELLSHTDGTYEIVDLDSHNGTFLNGQPADRALVSPGTSSASGTPPSVWWATRSRSSSTPVRCRSTSRTWRSPSTRDAGHCSTTSPSR